MVGRISRPRQPAPPPRTEGRARRGATPREAPRPEGWQPARGASTLDRALADRHLSDAEWGQVGDDLARAPADARRLLEAYVDAGVRFDPFAAGSAVGLLQEQGYDVPPRLDPDTGRARAPRVDLQQVVEGTVTEVDAAFEALSQLVGRGRAEVRVAIVDGGFSAHPLLEDNLRGERRARQPGAPVGTALGTFTDLERLHGAHHGTHVAGIATRGTSRIQASLFAVPLGVDGDPQARGKPGGVAQVREGLEAAAKSGAPVVNVSIECFVTPAEAAKFKAIVERHPDTLFVFGAGNDGVELGTSPRGPATLAESFKLPNLVVVGASAPDGGRWPDSNTSGRWVDLAARGQHIASADGDGEGLTRESGTSMAAPNVSNLAAKCRLLHPGLTPAQVVKLLSATSDAHRTWKGQVGSGGTVNAERAMRAAATLALVAGGATQAQALAKLALPAAERTRLARILGAL